MSARSWNMQQLADELRRSLGAGKYATRYANFTAICFYAGIDPSWKRVHIGSEVEAFLEHIIRSIEGVYALDGREYESETIRHALRWELGLRNRRFNLPIRRQKAREILGLLYEYTEDSWRREESPERDLMVILARQIVVTAEDQPLEPIDS